MNKFLPIVIEAFYWLAIFTSPFLAGLVLSVIVYAKTGHWWSLLFTLAGVAAGVILAEHIRRKYGCSNYIGRLLATPPPTNKKK